MNACADELKLVALDKDDIEVVSAHVQDALVKVADIFWQPREHRFVMALNRFDWMSAADAKPDAKADYRRCRTALRFERVLACKCRNLDQIEQGRAAQSARRRIRRARCAGRHRHADLLRRRRHSPRCRMPGGRARRSRRGFYGGVCARIISPAGRRRPERSHGSGVRGRARPVGAAKQLHQHDDHGERRRIDDELHRGRLIDIADQRVQRAAEIA